MVLKLSWIGLISLFAGYKTERVLQKLKIIYDILFELCGFSKGARANHRFDGGRSTSPRDQMKMREETVSGQ